MDMHSMRKILSLVSALRGTNDVESGPETIEYDLTFPCLIPELFLEYHALTIAHLCRLIEKYSTF